MNNILEAEMRRKSTTSFDGSHGMGDVTRTPCDATINITEYIEEYDGIEEASNNLMSQDNTQTAECCKHKSSAVTKIESLHEGTPKPLGNTHPPDYYSLEGSTNSEDKSDGDSGVSNSKYTIPINDCDEQGIKMAKIDKHGKLFTSL